MDVIDLTMNRDYYVPLTRKEMIEKLEYYKALTEMLDKKYGLKNKEYYELLDSLINLEISAFDIKFPSHVMIPNMLRDVLKYNVWHLTQKTIDKFNNRDIILEKKEERHGFVKVYESVIVDLCLKPPYAFTNPLITINSYESDYSTIKDLYVDLMKKQDILKNELMHLAFEQMYLDRVSDEVNEDESQCITEEDEEELHIEYSGNMQNKRLEENLERYFKLNEEVEENRKLLNMYRKSLCLYKDSIYKEVSHALMEEYHISHEEGKDLVKKLPWITLSKKSL